MWIKLSYLFKKINDFESFINRNYKHYNSKLNVMKGKYQFSIIHLFTCITAWIYNKNKMATIPRTHEGKWYYTVFLLNMWIY